MANCCENMELDAAGRCVCCQTDTKASAKKKVPKKKK